MLDHSNIFLSLAWARSVAGTASWFVLNHSNFSLAHDRLVLSHGGVLFGNDRLRQNYRNKRLSYVKVIGFVLATRAA